MKNSENDNNSKDIEVPLNIFESHLIEAINKVEGFSYGDIKYLNKYPNEISEKVLMDLVSPIATHYYDYNINNNRSSYYIKRFKYKENYRLGFIAQYKNGQWSEPLWIDDKVNNTKPDVGASSYSTGAFSATITSTVVNKLIRAGYKRVAPVVVYPQPTERNVIAQGVTCPTVYNVRDRNDNSPYIQSSWFFRFNVYSGNDHPLNTNSDRQGEIQCLDTFSTTNDMFKVDAKYQTFHSPDIECSLNKDSLDMNNLKLCAIAYANANSNKIINKYVTLETVGINPDKSQVINISFGSIFSGLNTYDYFTNSFPMYCDGLYNTENDEEVVEVKPVTEH